MLHFNSWQNKNSPTAMYATTKDGCMETHGRMKTENKTCQRNIEMLVLCDYLALVVIGQRKLKSELLT